MDIPLGLWPCGILPYLGSKKSQYSMGACAIIIYYSDKLLAPKSLNDFEYIKGKHCSYFLIIIVIIDTSTTVSLHMLCVGEG